MHSTDDSTPISMDHSTPILLAFTDDSTPILLAFTDGSTPILLAFY